MIIALSGTSRSGKTTVSRELEKIFKNLGFKVFYKKDVEYFPSKLVKKILGKAS